MSNFYFDKFLRFSLWYCTFIAVFVCLPCSVLCLDKLIMNKTTKIPAFRFNGKGQITAKKIHNTTFNSTESYKKIIKQRRLETVAVGNSLIVLSYRWSLSRNLHEGGKRALWLPSGGTFQKEHTKPPKGICLVLYGEF